MAEYTIICKRCGGEIKVSEGQRVVACPFCESPNTVSGSLASSANLFDRANALRRDNEFDKAAAVYEDILKQDNADYEAHWGAALCRYGIEYVIDPETGKRVPTCHRTQYDSILNDTDYLAAVEYAPLDVRTEYEAEGAYINKVQKGILALARKQEKFDVFLCYKETDEAGNRSEDSVLAQELEFELTKRGYRVFFARKTLQGKLGTAYEPVIFSALHSARVMVVLGTKPEHFTAVWVKNEWSRYRELIKKGEDKTLIPAYRGMSPYDLPQEFAHLQALDMGKLGFVQDLCDGIDKLVKVAKPSDGRAGSIAMPGVPSLMRRAQLFLEDGDFKSAADYADKILDIDPENAPAYIAKLQAGLGLRKEDDLGKLDAPLDRYADYLKALRFADSRLKAVYTGYNQSILNRIERARKDEQQRIENERKEEVYQAALQLKRKGNDMDFRCAGWEFQKISGYKDADTQAQECAQLAVQQKARMEQERLERERQAEMDRLEDQRLENLRIKKINRMLAFLIPAVLMIAVIIVFITQVITPRSKYQVAKNLLNSGQYDQAIEAFTELGNYADSQSIVRQAQADRIFTGGDFAKAYEIYSSLEKKYRTHESDYEQGYTTAEQLRLQGAYDEAATAFGELGGYQDAATRVKQAQADKLFAGGAYSGASIIYAALEEPYKTHAEDYAAMYATAEQLTAQGKYAEAADTFGSLGVYRDASIRMQQAQAGGLFAVKDYKNAYAIYITLDKAYRTHEADYKTMYEAAKAVQAVGDLDAAIAGYSAIENYLDSAEKLTQARYLKAQVLLDAGQLMDAEAMYALIPTYNDVQAKLYALRLRIANAAYEAKEYSRALEYYLKLPQTDDLKAREYALAQTCFDEGAYALATQTYELLGQYELSLSKLPVARYAYASQLFDQGKYALAVEQFEILGEMKDSVVRAKESVYQYGRQLMEQGLYDDAISAFSRIQGYNDANIQTKEANYRKATTMVQAGEYTQAAELFAILAGVTEVTDQEIILFQNAGEPDNAQGQYRDSYSQMLACRYYLAEVELKAGNYAEAEKRYRALGNYSDSMEKVKLCIYSQAEALLQAKDFSSAEKFYASISGYSDSTVKVKECRLKQGQGLYDARDWQGALVFLEDLGYGDSAQLAAECRYALGDADLMAGKTDEAVKEYALAAILPAAQERLYNMGKDYAKVEQYEKAIQALWSAGVHAPAQALLNELAGLLEQTGKPAMAVLAYCSLGNSDEVDENITRLASVISADALRQALMGFSMLPEDMAFGSECLYRYGRALTAIGKYTDAYAVLKDLKEYKDISSLIAGVEGLSSAAASELERRFTVGNIVTFGKYEQDNNTTNRKEPVRWRVLAREGRKALLISVKNLDCQRYNKEDASVTWETCTLRAWLNDEFMKSAFSAEEQEAILTTTVKNEDNPNLGIQNGEDTSDRVFLLSIAEATSLFKSDSDRKAANTDYATKAQGAYDSGGFGVWWLRSRGYFGGHSVARVNTDGSVDHNGGYVNFDNHVVRPALTINMDSEIF